MPYFPLPNQPGQLNGQLNNYQATPADRDAYWNFLGRLDFNISSKHKISFGAHSNWRRDNLNQLFSGITTGVERYRIGSGGSLDDVYSFSPTMFLNARIGWTRFNDPDTVRSAGFNATTLGFPASMQASSIEPIMPGIHVYRRDARGSAAEQV
jgi:hypothetical protein